MIIQGIRMITIDLTRNTFNYLHKNDICSTLIFHVSSIHVEKFHIISEYSQVESKTINSYAPRSPVCPE